MAAVLPTLKTWTRPVWTPDALTMRRDLIGQVVHLAAAVRVKRQFPLEDHTVIIIRQPDRGELFGRMKDIKTRGFGRKRSSQAPL